MAAPVPDGAAAAADNDIPMDDTDDTWGVTEIGPNDYKAAYSDAYGITGATVYHDVDVSMIMSYGDSTEAEQTNTTLALGDIDDALMFDAVGPSAGAGGAGAGAHGTGIGTAGYTGTATTKGLRGPMRNARVFAPKAFILTQKDAEDDPIRYDVAQAAEYTIPAGQYAFETRGAISPCLAMLAISRPVRHRRSDGSVTKTSAVALAISGGAARGTVAKMLRAQKTPEAKLESFKLKRGDQATICTIIVPRQNVDCCDTLRHVADARGSVRRIVLKVV